MKLNTILSGFEKAKSKHNEIVSDKIEKLSDEKERADDLLTSIREKLQSSTSQAEHIALKKQIAILHARKTVLQDRISRVRKRKI